MYIKKVLIILVLSQFIFLFSCSSNNTSTTNTSNTAIKTISNEETFYVSISTPPIDEIENIIDYLYVNKKIYILAKTSKGAIVLCETDVDFSYYIKYELNFNYDVQDYHNDILKIANSDDELFILGSHSKYDEDGAITECINTLSIFDFTGELKESNEVNFDYENEDVITINKLVYINDKTLICSSDEVCFIIDRNGTLIKSIHNDSNLFLDFAVSENSDIFTLIGNKNTNYLCNIDAEKLELTNLAKTINLSGALANGINGYDLFIYNQEAIYGIKEGDLAVKVVDLSLSGLHFQNKILSLPDNNFLCQNGNGFVILSQNATPISKDIQIIDLAITSNLADIKEKVAYYNSVSNNYKINIIDYSSESDFSIEGLASATTQLEMDIISGNAPDILWLDTNEIQKLASKGTFVDLYDFINNEKEYPKTAFLKNILDANETQGHLYSIAPTFTVKTIATKKKWLDQLSWNIDDFFKIYNSYKSKMVLFPNGNNNVAVLSFLTNNGANYVDYNNYSCDFNSDDFIRVLEFSSQFPDVEEYDFEQYSCKNDSALLSVMYIKSFRDINIQKQCVFGKDDISFIGYPSKNKTESMILLTEQFAIMNDSSHKDGAWDFIRFQFSNEFYQGGITGIPITEDGFKLVMDEALERPYYVEENGQKNYYDEKGIDIDSNYEIPIDVMNEFEKNEYEQFIRSLHNVTSGNTANSISSILQEETDSYFHNECNTSECVERLQNRISILLSEQS